MISHLDNLLLCSIVTRRMIVMMMMMENMRETRLIDDNTDSAKSLSDGPGSDDVTGLEFDDDLNNGDALEEM